MESLEYSINLEKKEKPELLYISAQTSGITELVPQKGRYRDQKEGPVIFSTPDKALASAFLVKNHNSSWMKIGYYGDILVVAIDSDKETFLESDTGGSVYTVSSKTFDFDPNKGMGEKEWTSVDSVKPIAEIQYPSALEAMIENGVQVYFIDTETLRSIKESNDYGYNILSKLTSENERRGQNIKSIKDLNL